MAVINLETESLSVDKFFEIELINAATKLNLLSNITPRYLTVGFQGIFIPNYIVENLKFNKSGVYFDVES